MVFKIFFGDILVFLLHMHPLIQHIQKMTGSREADEAQILSCFETKLFKKKELLLTEGQLCSSYFFVLKGCLRLFFIDGNGMEQTMQLALENWWMTDLDAFRSGRRAGCNIQALEPTEVLVLSAKNYTLLLDAIPLIEKYFRLVYERAYSASLSRIRMISRMPKNEFYERFESLYPDFTQRVPQKVLASFLGFTPEYLSELRKKRVENKHT